MSRQDTKRQERWTKRDEEMQKELESPKITASPHEKIPAMESQNVGALRDFRVRGSRLNF